MPWESCSADFRAIKCGWVRPLSASRDQPGFVILMGTEHKCLAQVSLLGSRSLRSDLIVFRARALLCQLVSPDPCPTGMNGELTLQELRFPAPLMPGCAPHPSLAGGTKN